MFTITTKLSYSFSLLQKSFSSLLSLLHSHFTSLFQYSQGASHLWDTYLLNLDETSRTHEHQLASLRSQHDTNNQTLEANLDYVLDRLRQASSQEVSLYLF